jgi:hypothetical protein
MLRTLRQISLPAMRAHLVRSSAVGGMAVNIDGLFSDESMTSFSLGASKNRPIGADRC